MPLCEQNEFSENELVNGVGSAAGSDWCRDAAVAPGRPAVAAAAAAAVVVEDVSIGWLPPPHGNTGGKLTDEAKSLAVCNDNLRVHVALELLPVVRAMVSEHLGQPELGTGIRWYTEGGWRWSESGAILAWSSSRAMLVLGGEALRQIRASDPRKEVKLYRELAELDAVPTRLDPCLDDYSMKLLRMDDVHAAGLAGHVVGYKNYKPNRSYDMRSGELTGDTAYFGERGANGSGKYARIYRKDLESRGLVMSTRMECEFSGEVAKVAWDMLICELNQAVDEGSCPVEAMRRRLARWCGGSIIDFREKTTKTGASAHNHRDRRQRLEWWEKLVSILGEGAKLSVERAEPKLQSQAKWLLSMMGRLVGVVGLKVDETGHDGRSFLADWVDRNILKVKESGYRAEAAIDFPALMGWARERINVADWLGSREYLPDGTRVLHV